MAIKVIELAIVEKGFKEGWIKPHPPAQRTGKKVAVIGSGPAGLACADQLNHAGHQIVVFERSERLGGLLMNGIPNMKLDKSIVQRRTDLMTAEGVEFRKKTEVGVDFPAEQLLTDFDAVVMCGGATKPRDLQIEGRELQGIHFAMDFLHANTRNLMGGSLWDVEPLTISARGKHVVVIGGGDTGTDCVATSLRHGCRKLAQFEIMPQPPLERLADNPWPEWPKVYKLDYGQEEAAAVYGRDPRYYEILTKRFVGDDAGQVKEIHTVNVEWVAGENGRMMPQEIPGTEQVWKADLVLLAMGFLGPEDQLLQKLDVARDARSNVQTSEGSYATNIAGVYAAGDMRRGQSLVVWAIQEGRQAAEEVDQYLMAI